MKLVPMLGVAALAVASCDRSDWLSAKVSGEALPVRQLGAAEYDSFIATPGAVVAILYHADWCGPCRKFGPVVEEVVAEFGSEVLLGRVDVDENRELVQRQGVSGIPDLRLFRDGIMVDSMVGAHSEEQVRSRFRVQVDQLTRSTEEALPDDSADAEPAVQPMTKDWRPPGIERR